MTKIVYFDVAPDETDFLKQENEGKYDYILTEKSLNSMETLPEEYKSAKIISCFTTSRIGRDVLKQFNNLQLIALRSVGFNHVDIDYCTERGIVVENTPNYGNKSVAEFAFGLMIDVCRKITKSYLDYKNMEINPQNLIGNELGGKNIGIIGLGAIGKEFAKLAHGFDMKILGFDLREDKAAKTQFNIEYTDFDTLLANSDFISLHTPLTKQNYHMFNEKSFKKMRNNAILINTARGELIETQALYNALTQKEIAGAGLDVLESEETISDPDYLVDISRLNKCVLKDTILNTRLQQFENVIITPHIAYNTHEAVQRILQTTMKNINAFDSGKIQNNVN